MKNLPVLLLLCVVGTGLVTGVAHASDDDVFLGEIQPRQEQTMGQGRSALWTLPLVATQYQPVSHTPEMRSALKAQQEGRFLEALILLDEAGKTGQLSAESAVELSLLRASFLLQGNQSPQAIEILTPLLANAQHGADASALAAMAYLQQGQMQQAQEAANRAHDADGNILPHLAQSYTLQSAGRLAEAREMMHSVNSRTPQSAITLAREAELALTLAQVKTAKALLIQAREIDAAHPYVIAVSGLAWLIDGQAQQAKVAFVTALQRDPQDARALLGLALAEIKLGNLEAGLKKLQAANEADPDNALILTYLGRSQQQLGQNEAARASWQSAQQADPKDPAPWLYQAQAELQANRPLDARESVREAQKRTAYRAVYRGENLLQEDSQLLQANLAEIQRKLGMESLAFRTLDDPLGASSASNLMNQADLLQGQRFGESARRSLLLQSQFNNKPGNLPAALDSYGDGAGQTGATVPLHGAVSSLNAQQASYNNYDALFSPRTLLEADVTSGSHNSNGGQVRLGVGSETLGLGLAGLRLKTDGFDSFDNLDNRVMQGIVQWQPNESMQAFVSYQSFNSVRGEIRYPVDPLNLGEYHQIEDNSGVTRLGLRYSLDGNSEVRGLVSRQQTRQTDNWEWIANTPPYSDMPCCGPMLAFPQFTYLQSSETRGAELQYRRSGAGYATQWGASSVRSPFQLSFGEEIANVAQQLYVDWEQVLNPSWQLQAGLAWGKNDRLYSVNSTYSTYLRRWLPKLGLVYTPDSATHVRLAAWKNLDNAAAGNATLAPATLAGIVLDRPGDTYKLVRGVALGADKQLDAAWLLEGQVRRRWADAPFYSEGQSMSSWQIDESRLALHWQPANQSLNVTLAYDDERTWSDPSFHSPDSIQEQHLRSQQLSLRWLASAQWTANLGWSHNWIAATQQSSDSSFNFILLDVRERFNQMDASLDWQFNKNGSASIGVRNATGRGSQYTETDPLVPRFSKGRLWYAKLKLAL